MIPRTWATLAAPKAKSLVVVKDADKFADAMVQRTLSGVVSLAAGADADVAPLWIDNGKAADSTWRQLFSTRYGLNNTDGGSDLWALVKSYADTGVLKGFVVYAEDTSGGGTGDSSANIATSLCGPLGAIAVSADQVPAATGAGLTQLADARGMSFADLVSQHGDKFSKSTLGLLRTDQAR